MSVLFTSTALLMTDCKKSTTTPPITPAFIVTSTTVTLQTGGFGLQFYAKCTNTDVKLTKVTISDPLQTGNVVYNLNSTTYVQNQIFDLQDANTAYIKQSGNWQFTFVGNRTSDGGSFAAVATVAVSGK